MRRQIWILQFFLLLVYIGFFGFLYLFNWSLFNTVLNISVAFGSIQVAPISLLFFVSSLLLVFFWITTYIMYLQSRVDVMEKKEEILEAQIDIEKANDTIRQSLIKKETEKKE